MKKNPSNIKPHQHTTNDPPTNFYGVDFSGAVNAGKNIWIAKGVIEDNTLQINKCFPASSLTNGCVERNKCLKALTDFVAKSESAIFGMDFPFSLPASMIEQKSWAFFAKQFTKNYSSPEDFREKCRGKTGGGELKRKTDIETKTPFSPYNLRIYRQTYYGISQLLSPLVKKNQVCVLPMQKNDCKKPWVIEVCPASLLKREKLYIPYKGKGKDLYSARLKIIDMINNKLATTTKEVNTSAIDNQNGDALDSILATISSFNAINNTNLVTKNQLYAIEGYVYA